MVGAVDADTSARLAGGRVAVAVAPLAVRVVPEAWLALVAAPAVRVGPALALAGGAVAEVVQRAHRVTVTRCGAERGTVRGCGGTERDGTEAYCHSRETLTVSAGLERNTLTQLSS